MGNEALFQERFERFKKVVNLEPVDRVPVAYMGSAFAPRYMGIPIGEYCASEELAWQVPLAVMDRLGGFDGANLIGGGRITVLLTTIWLSRLLVPGKDLPNESLWQVQEAEVMTHEDYDAILKMGWTPFVQSYLPRVIDPSEVYHTFGYMAENGARIGQAIFEHGYVRITDAPVNIGIPFEYLCGGRSMNKFFMDLYRMPDKIEAVMQVILEDQLAQIAAAPQIPGIFGGTWLGGWRSASALVAPKLWNRFVWPYFVKLADALIAKGFTPVLHWDQDWTRDLGCLKDLPAKKCIMNPDGMTDMRKFKEVAGDRMAMMGDIPAALMSTGTPDDVFKYVREQVELFEGRGLILCPGCDAPINTRPENMKAFVAAAREFGTVSA